MTRTGLLPLGAKVLAVANRLVAPLSKPAPVLAWAPRTPLGTNITNAFFWNLDVDPTQRVLFDALGVSFVRGGMSIYGYAAEASSASHPAIWVASSCRTYAGDTTQLEFVVDRLSYPIASGEILRLSAPVTFFGGITIPAQTDLICKGGTPAVWNRYGRVSTYGTVRVSAGGASLPRGSQACNVSVLHKNFYLEGAQVRAPIPAYLDKIGQWLAIGIAFDHGQGLPAFEQITQMFGRDASRFLRQQEWAYFAQVFANRGWTPSQIIISDGPEPLLSGIVNDPRSLWLSFRSELTWIYSTLRRYFPDHTLALAVPNYASLNSSLYIAAWPGDTNSVLRVHAYPPDLSPPGPASFPLDCSNVAALSNYMDGLAAFAHRVGLPKIYFQEVGIKMEQPTAQARYANLRTALLARNWWTCLWSAEQYGLPPSGMNVLYKGNTALTGPWVQVPGVTGAFGLN